MTNPYTRYVTYVYIQIREKMYVSIQLCAHIFTYAYMYLYVQISNKCVHIDTCEHVYMNISMCI